MKSLFEFNFMQYSKLCVEHDANPNDFNTYAQMKYYEGVCVGLKLAMDHGKR